MELEIIQPDAIHNTQVFSYSQAVRMGELVFTAGHVSLDRSGNLVGAGDIRAQTEQVFSNLSAVLEAAGSGLDKVGKVTVFIVDLEHRPIVHEVRSRIFAEIGHFPASTLAVVSSLAKPEWLVEIEAIALAR